MAQLDNIRLHGQTLPELTACIIGRNESQKLPRCADSIRALKDAGISYESIYVDSASKDHSVCIAKSHFDIVITLAESPDLNASAARAVGTEHARGDFILYLDGDMTLNPDFIPIIKRLLNHCSGFDGIAGRTLNLYPDGSSEFIIFHGNKDLEPCRAFGGAVMLKRTAVLKAGNWAQNLYSNEEVELYSRLLKRGSKVLWTDATMVEHITEKFNNTGKLLGNLIPYHSFLGKKFYGAGQATRLVLSGGNFADFVRLKPYQYMMTSSLLGFAILLPFNVYGSLALPSLTFGIISLRRGIKFSINCICWASQILFGWLKLNVGFRPDVTEVFRQADQAPITP